MRKYVKKVVAVAAASMMLAVSGISVMAAPSSEVDGIVTEVVGAVNQDGEELEVVTSAVSDEYQDAVLDLEENLESMIDEYTAGMVLLDVRQLELRSGTWTAGSTVTFDVPGVADGTTVILLVYDETVGEWQRIESVVGDGTVTATLDVLGMVAFVVDEDTLDGSEADVPSEDAESSDEDDKKSPTTGEGYGTTVVMTMVVVAMAGAVVLKKRVVA